MSANLVVDMSSGAMHLSRAILLYSSPHSKGMHATLHDVVADKDSDSREIQPGVLLTRETLSATLGALADGAGSRSWSFVDNMVLASGPDMCAWFTEPGVRHCAFQGALEGAGPASQPALLWIAGGGQLFMFALTLEGKRPALDSEVFHAPHYNVWRGGRVCLGNMKRCSASDRAGWEASFFSSYFTHPNDGAKWQTRFRGGAPALWAKLLKEGGKKPFPDATLASTGATVQQIIEAVMSTGCKQAGGAR